MQSLTSTLLYIALDIGLIDYVHEQILDLENQLRVYSTLVLEDQEQSEHKKDEKGDVLSSSSLEGESLQFAAR